MYQKICLAHSGSPHKGTWFDWDFVVKSFL